MTNNEPLREDKPLSNRTWRTIVVGIVICAFTFLGAGENLAGALQVFSLDVNGRNIEQASTRAITIGGIVFVAVDWICEIIKKKKINPLRKLAS